MSSVVWSPSRWTVALLVTGLTVLSACTDVFFFEPAVGGNVPITVSFSLAEASASAAASSGPGDAFDKADGVHAELEFNGQIIHSETVALTAVGQDKQFTLNLDLEGQAISVTLFLDLMSGSNIIFTGSQALSLSPGQPASADVPLTPFTTSLQVNNVPSTLRLGLSAQLDAEALFSTGDGTGSVAASWQALTSNVQVTSSGTVTGTAQGWLRCGPRSTA